MKPIAVLSLIPRNYLWGVLAPLVVVVGYVLLLQTPRFESQASLIVERADPVANALPSLELGLLNLGGSSQTKSDAAMLESFIRSRRLFETLDAELGLIAHWQDPAIDGWSRLSAQASQEDMLEYYRSMVTIDVDPDSLIVSLGVQAFAPDFARAVLSAILRESEAFINDISQNLARTQVQFAEQEMERALARVREASETLLRFQGSADMLSPEAEAEASLQILGALQARIAGLETELGTLRSYLNEDAPDVIALRNRIQATRAQIEAQRARQTGSQAPGLNRVLLDFKEAELTAQLAADLYKVGLQTLEAARLEATRKGKFVVLIDAPSLPDEAAYPDHWRSLLLALLTLHILYFLARLIWAAIREHSD